METTDRNMGAILGEIGCRFRSNIENHIKDYELQKEDDVEWLLGPLDAIIHSPEIVLDAFQYETPWESWYELYFHNKDATQAYVAYNEPFMTPERRKRVRNSFYLLTEDEKKKASSPNSYSKDLLIKETLNVFTAKVVPSCWDEIVVPFTEVGIWQAVLLNETIALFPKGWHANYLEKTYVFSKADMQKIVDDKKSKYEYTDEEIEKLNAYWRFLDMTPHFGQNKKSNYDRLVSYLDREDIIPSVEINGDKAVASYCYWSEWSGFCRASVPVERRGQSVSVGKAKKEVLIAYDCGICY